LQDVPSHFRSSHVDFVSTNIMELVNELVNLKVKMNKLTEDNRTLRKGIKKFMNPDPPQANLIEL
jgi:regulator of replication initiation timing